MADVRIGVVGATGAVGTVTLDLLAERGLESVRGFASARSAGRTVGFGDRELLVDNVLVQIQKYNGNAIGLQFPPHVLLTVTSSEPGARGDTASGSVTKVATLETGLQIRVPLFIKDGEKVKVHTETREFAGRA